MPEDGREERSLRNYWKDIYNEKLALKLLTERKALKTCVPTDTDPWCDPAHCLRGSWPSFSVGGRADARAGVPEASWGSDAWEQTQSLEEGTGKAGKTVQVSLPSWSPWAPADRVLWEPRKMCEN